LILYELTWENILPPLLGKISPPHLGKISSLNWGKYPPSPGENIPPHLGKISPLTWGKYPPSPGENIPDEFCHLHLVDNSVWKLLPIEQKLIIQKKKKLIHI
jgi:hypothetical protein